MRVYQKIFIKHLILFSLIPIVLSIGITPALSFAEMEPSRVQKQPQVNSNISIINENTK